MGQHDFASIPQELKERCQWVTWRWMSRDGKLTKVPHDPRTGNMAKPNDAATWTSFDTAIAAVQSHQVYSGIGYVFSADDPYAGVDLDKCRDAATGEIEPWAQAVITTLDSYAEVSPSGTGVHLLVAARVPDGGNRRGKVEMYSAGRYFTVTGQRVDGTPATINARQDEIAAIHSHYFSAPRKERQGGKASASTTPRGQHIPSSVPPIADDAALIRHAMNADNGITFARLWNGDSSANGEDDSAADLALCNLLAFWCGDPLGDETGDPERIDRLFRQSRLMRPKWDRADYRERTITAALAGRKEWYHGSTARKFPGSTSAVGGGASGNEGAHHTADGDRDQASDTKTPPEDETVPPAHPYRDTRGGLVWMKTVQARDGGMAEVPVPLANFTATIKADITEDDGQETHHAFALEAKLNRRTYRFSVPAERFNGMGWPTEHMGAMAVIYPGQSIKDHARTAVQLLSGEIPARRVYTHTGWRQVDGDAWVYLHAGGAVGASGTVPDITVALEGVLHRYELPTPTTGDPLVKAIRASLKVLDVAPDIITVPVYASIWRAVLGESDFGEHMTGASGEGKTALAALAQQHFGATMDATHLPGSWTSTGNANEALAFAAKDALFVVDDLVTIGTAVDQQRLHRDADRLLRAQANQAGRARLRADTTGRAAKYPRGVILSTGEDMLRGHSLLARVLILQHERGTMNWKTLTACQHDAESGLYAAALAGYVRWLAPQYATVRAGLRTEAAQLRDRIATADQHRRTPGIAADLALGIRSFIRFAQSSGALSKDEASAYLARTWKALVTVAEEQSRYQAASEPAHRFLELLIQAITSGEAHLATLSGGYPGSTGQNWGWQVKETLERVEWIPRGLRVGWVDGDHVYLIPDAAHAVAQHLGRATDDPLNVGARTVHKRLHEQHLLVSEEDGRGHTIRKQCEGAGQTVLHLRAADLLGERKTAKTANSESSVESDGAKPGTNGSFSGSLFDAARAELPTAHPGMNRAGDAIVSFGSYSNRRDADYTQNGHAWADVPPVPPQKTAKKTDNEREKTANTASMPDSLEGAPGDCVVSDQVLICPKCGGTRWYDAGERYGKRCQVHDLVMVPGGSAA